VDYCADLTHTELHFAYYDDVVVRPGLSYLSIGIRRVSDLQPVYLLGMDGLDRVGLAAEFGYGYELLYVLLH
jgi:hypothetical protein